MHLHYLNGEKAGTRYEVGPAGVGIGRETDNGIQLLVGGVSRYHARVEMKKGEWYLLDLGSTNGTRLNGNLISAPAPLRNGDVFSIGEQTFRVEDEKEEKTSAAAPSAEKNPAGAEKTSSAPEDPDAPAFVFRPPESQTPAAPRKMISSFAHSASSSGPEPSAGNTVPPIAGNLFKKDGSDEPGAEPEAMHARKRIMNLLFVLLVLIVATVVIWIFFRMQQPDPNAGARSGRSEEGLRYPNPFLLVYEKTEISQENVFCFRLWIEGDRATVSLVDFKSGRDYVPPSMQVSKESVEKLKKAIEDTNFMKTPQQEKIHFSGEQNRKYSRLVVGYDDKFHELAVQDFVLTSFSQVESAVLQFLQEECRIDPSAAASKEELLETARQVFIKAQKEFGSFRTNPANLPLAIDDYQFVVERLEIFENKPEEWTVARKNLAEARAIQEGKKKEHQDRWIVYARRQDFDSAILECDKLLPYFSPHSETYQKILDQKRSFEKIRKEMKKR